MAINDPQPVNSSTSLGFSFTTQSRVADPFTASGMTWTEVVASTSAAWDGFTITIATLNQRAGPFLIATGAASSESIIAVVPANPVRIFRSFNMYVPIPIASGTRVSVACSLDSSETIYGQIEGDLRSNHTIHPTFTNLDCGPFHLENDADYGRGVTIDAGGTANTKGSWTEMSKTTGNGPNNILNGDSLDNTYSWFGACAGKFEASTWNEDVTFLFDIGTGAASSETVQMADKFTRSSIRELANTGFVMFETGAFTSGTRVACRAQASSTTAAERTIQPYLFGLR